MTLIHYSVDRSKCRKQIVILVLDQTTKNKNLQFNENLQFIKVLEKTKA